MLSRVQRRGAVRPRAVGMRELWGASVAGLALLLVLGMGARSAHAIPAPEELEEVQAGEGGGNLERCTQQVRSRDFADVFECGDVFFGTRFNAADGVGANVGDGSRFARSPRADLNAPGQWARHVPARATGPNATSCADCHNLPAEDGAGDAAGNNVRDPLRTRDPSRFIQRNPPHIFGAGAVQLLAEEMSAELQLEVERARSLALSSRGEVTQSLTAKGVPFGSVVVSAAGEARILSEGIDGDLVVKPFDWKGVFRTLREFVRDASHNELGMNPVETAGAGIDGDGDGVVNEVGIDEITALALYQAGQPRPTTRVELSDLREQLVKNFAKEGERIAAELELPTVAPAERASILRGTQFFARIGCESCHRASLRLDGRVFSEPSQSPSFRESEFPGGQKGLDPRTAITFDLTRDQPDNRIEVGGKVIRFGAFPANANGSVTIPLLGDLRRHDMGARLAENIDAAGTGVSVFLTENLWGVGSTAPYLHDGRATTLTEAILEHGGEADAARLAFLALSAEEREDVIHFLKNQVLVLFGGDEEESDESGHAGDAPDADDDTPPGDDSPFEPAPPANPPRPPIPPRTRADSTARVGSGAGAEPFRETQRVR